MRSDFFFASPSIWYGFAGLLDVGGTFDRYNFTRTAEEADARAVYCDWRMVGLDLVSAIQAFQGQQDASVPRAEHKPEQLRLQLL